MFNELTQHHAADENQDSALSLSEAMCFHLVQYPWESSRDSDSLELRVSNHEPLRGICHPSSSSSLSPLTRPSKHFVVVIGERLHPVLCSAFL